jgi:hypothetical protein
MWHGIHKNIHENPLIGTKVVRKIKINRDKDRKGLIKETNIPYVMQKLG